MSAITKLSPDLGVVVTTSGERYHRPSPLPGRKAACATEFPNGVTVRSRAECEQDGYEPCRKVGCFGRPAQN